MVSRVSLSDTKTSRIKVKENFLSREVLGPLIAGGLTEAYNFDWAMTYLAVFYLLFSILSMSIHTFWGRKFRSKKEKDSDRTAGLAAENSVYEGCKESWWSVCWVCDDRIDKGSKLHHSIATICCIYLWTFEYHTHIFSHTLPLLLYCKY